MDLKTQLLVLGLLQSKKYEFNKRGNEILNGKSKIPLEPMLIGKKPYFRFFLGFSERIDLMCSHVMYLLHFGLYEPTATIINKDGDVFNNDPENLVLSSKKRSIPNHIKQEICKMWEKGWWYEAISDKTGISHQSVKDIIENHFGEVRPNHSQENRAFRQSVLKQGVL